MDHTLWTLPLRGKRDALLARQRSRHIAALLGFDFQEQACISAGVFALAWQVLHLKAPLEVCFALKGESLQVFVQGSLAEPRPQGPSTAVSILKLERLLPARTKVSLDDLDWAIHHLNEPPPGWMYDEMHRVNQELLATLHALRTSQAQLADHQEKPSAA